MNADFLAVLEFWEREKGISRNVLVNAVQEALLSAAKKAVGAARELRHDVEQLQRRCRGLTLRRRRPRFQHRSPRSPAVPSRATSYQRRRKRRPASSFAARPARDAFTSIRRRWRSSAASVNATAS